MVLPIWSVLLLERRLKPQIAEVTGIVSRVCAKTGTGLPNEPLLSLSNLSFAFSFFSFADNWIGEPHLFFQI